MAKQAYHEEEMEGEATDEDDNSEDGEDEEDEGEERTHPRHVGHNIYILAHQVRHCFTSPFYMQSALVITTSNWAIHARHVKLNVLQ